MTTPLTTAIEPYNPTTGKPYSGGNVSLLLESGYRSNAFATFRQWLQHGRAVRKGETGTRIAYVRDRKPQECVQPTGEVDAKKLNSAIVRHYHVFAIEQTDPIEEREA